MAIKEYDVFVIGTGTAGKTVAFDCAAEEMKVAIADNREFGGTCANRGCDPKKVLVGITEAIHLSECLEGKGIVTVPKIDWAALQEFKSTFTDAVPASTEKKIKEAGIDMFHQSPKFLDENTLSVEGKTVKAKKIVIATGQKPMELKIPGREHLMISDDFLNLKELPESIVFVGAGYIGMEFAHIAARCGAKVTVIEFGDRPLHLFEAAIVSHLTKASEELGIKFIFNAKVSAVEKLQKNYRVSFQKNGKTESVDTRMVFNTAGRVPSIDKLDLEKGYKITVEYKSVPKWFNAKRISEKVYAYKTIVDKDRNLILGAHIIASEAGEMINLFVLAMCGKLTTENLKAMIFAYPTWGNDIKGMV
ncbi:NAD(P)/FAD-dependent oxidoreductase [Aequorivita sp. F47161]|uniref:Dihydrolipoyl dehydrogenase n=2 Tax=Aequorivita vitellina TaxID=2874475 RepID=A0A9X1QUX0_9FLAO|nr:NAD(P)/FAD-dependent oxidoreductase [Aequorivita vitellina]MCG2419966.1 NAD(P)/FAD-dependent oxidoreductase [Aequorivita vitellina]